MKWTILKVLLKAWIIIFSDGINKKPVDKKGNSDTELWVMQ
jgi:hypothetical protein